VEFTVSDYRDVTDLGFNRGQGFCMVTLQHPAFADLVGGAAAGKREKIYTAKEEETTRRIDEVFLRYAGGEANVLEGENLKAVLEYIGQRGDDFTVASFLQRHARNGARHVTREDFDGVVKEVWGKSRSVNFHDGLVDIYRQDGRAPLEGNRALMWCGRDSPVHWMLRVIKHTWPYALNRVKIVRNTAPNPELDPELMEVCFAYVARQQFDEMMTVSDLANTAAAANDPTAKGGFLVRLCPFDPDAAPLHVPLRGLPENAPQGVMSGLFSRFSWA